jgi:hypothetical protein
MKDCKKASSVERTIQSIAMYRLTETPGSYAQ